MGKYSVFVSKYTGKYALILGYEKGPVGGTCPPKKLSENAVLQGTYERGSIVVRAHASHAEGLGSSPTRCPD